MEKIKIAIRKMYYRRFVPGFREFEREYRFHYIEEGSPEIFMRDGERVLTKRERHFLDIIRGPLPPF